MEPAAAPPPPSIASEGQAGAVAQPGAEAEQQREPEQRTDVHAADTQQAAAASRQLAVLGLSAAYLHRYQHYARHLALFVLRHGSTGLVAVLRTSCQLVHTAVTQLRAWAAASKLPRAAALHLARALAALGQLLRLHVGRPLGRLLTQLVWVQVRLSTDDALDDGTRLSARLNSAVSLLFGSVRFRSHSCLQLALPSRQPVLSPEFSLTSPCPSPRRTPLALTAGQHDGTLQRQQQQQRQSMLRTASSPVPAGSSHGQQQDAAAAAADARHSSSSGAALRHGRSSAFASGFYSSGWPQALGFTSQERASLAHALRMSHHPGAAGSASADAEVHVLCSSELRQAILSFLQAHSQANGSEWVLLRNLGSATSHSSALSTPRASEDAAGAVEGVAAHAAAAAGAARTVPAEQLSQADGCGQALAAVAGSCCTDPGSGGAAGGSSSSQTSSTGASGASSGRQSAHVFVDAAAASGGITWPDSSSSSDTKLVSELPIVEAAPDKQQQQQHDAVAATELQQALSALGAGKQQRPPVLARSATAGAEHLRHSSSSSIKERARSDAAAAAAAATGSGAPLQLQDSFTTAADLFRSLAAAAAAAAEAEPRSPGKAPTSAARASINSISGGGGSPDPCSRPLMSFERGSPARSSSMGSRHVPVPAPAPAPATAAGYMRLFPPGSRSSYEALSLRKSCDNALGTPACHAKTGLAASSSLSAASSATAAAAAAGAAAGAGGTRKKLPAAPFSLSKSGSLDAPLRPAAASAGGGVSDE